MADQHPFLSAEWIAAAREIRESYRDKLPTSGLVLRMNQVVTDAPGGTTIEAHLDTSSGEAHLSLGHLETADLTITVDYATAKAIFVNQDMAAAMQAFLTGQIKVDGDVSKLLMLQAQAGALDPLAREIATKIKEITS